MSEERKRSALSPASLIAESKRLRAAALKHGPKIGKLHARVLMELNIDAENVIDPEEVEFDSIGTLAEGCAAHSEGIEFDFEEINIEALVANGTPSGFGDIRTLKTVVDPTVRKAVEYRKHPIIDEAMEVIGANYKAVDSCAESVFSTSNVELIPKKLNVYSVGGFFSKHVDTPVPHPMHLGTAVMVLPVKHEGGDLLIRDSLYKPYKNYDSWIVMFPSWIQHEVTPVTSGTRVTVAFDVYLKQKPESEDRVPISPKENPETHEDYASAVTLGKTVLERHRGGCAMAFILANKYSGFQSLPYGSDKAFTDVLDRVGLKWEFRHVHIDTYVQHSLDSEDDYWTKIRADVYDVDEAAIATDTEYTFYTTLCGGETALLDSRSVTGGHTGNESAPSEKEMIYFASAILILP